MVKDDTTRSIIEAVRCAAENQNYLPPLIAKRVMGTLAAVKSGKLDTTSSNGSTPLSHRELNVLQMMAEGARNREIADKLCISERTVGNHITNIFDKLHIYQRSQAIVYAIKTGIIRI